MRPPSGRIPVRSRARGTARPPHRDPRRAATLARAVACALAGAMLLQTAAARAAAPPDPSRHPFQLFEVREDEQGHAVVENRASPRPPGYFGGLGTFGRTWQIQSDTAFDTKRVFTQRFEVARAVPWIGELAVVIRTDVATDAALPQGTYGLQGPIASVGVRDQSASGEYWLEFGVRLIFPWLGPDDRRPSTQQLALSATLASGLADDARWLPFSDLGMQIYGAIRTQTEPLGNYAWTLLPGMLYGGEASLWPLRVQSWLGPQTGFVGNAFLELFLGLPRIASWDANVRVGAHGEVSLSTIWPTGVPFPMSANGFIAWSPEYCFAARLFIGLAGSPGASNIVPMSEQYGARVEAYFP
jgi:hypothetical protein